MNTDGNGHSRYHITFTVNNTTFALDNEMFHQVKFMRTVKKIPSLPEGVLGKITHRRCSVPVIDIRARLGLPAGGWNSDACVVLTEKVSGHSRYVLGLISETLPDVIGFDPDSIHPPSSPETPIKRDYIKGIGKHKNEEFVILDFDKLFSLEDLDELVGSWEA